jgi:hypothetical protein
VDWVAAEWGGILPPFSKDSFGIADCRALNGQLDVVPWRPHTVDGRHLLVLRVAAMVLVSATTHRASTAGPKC